MLADGDRAKKCAARFDVYTQSSRHNHMALVEVWDNEDAWRSHLSAKHTEDFRISLLPRSGSVYDERVCKAAA